MHLPSSFIHPPTMATQRPLHFIYLLTLDLNSLSLCSLAEMPHGTRPLPFNLIDWVEEDHAAARFLDTHCPEALNFHPASLPSLVSLDFFLPVFATPFVTGPPLLQAQLSGHPFWELNDDAATLNIETDALLSIHVTRPIPQWSGVLMRIMNPVVIRPEHVIFRAALHTGKTGFVRCPRATVAMSAAALHSAATSEEEVRTPWTAAENEQPLVAQPPAQQAATNPGAMMPTIEPQAPTPSGLPSADPLQEHGQGNVAVDPNSEAEQRVEDEYDLPIVLLQHVQYALSSFTCTSLPLTQSHLSLYPQIPAHLNGHDIATRYAPCPDQYAHLTFTSPQLSHARFLSACVGATFPVVCYGLGQYVPPSLPTASC